MSTRRKSQYRKTRDRRSGKSISLGWILTIAAIALISLGAWRFCNNTVRSDQSTPRAPFGDLTEVVTAADLQQQRISYPGMEISFNSKMHIPNWVAWELTAEEVAGNKPRINSFHSDPDVEGCPETYDYSYSGYDRGHMAPAGDMKWSDEAMLSSFSLANICPQVKSLNTGAWKRLEEKCRTWAKADSAIYIVCGPILNDPIREYIGDSRVAVPKRFFKVVISPYTNPARGIAFIMPNAKVVGGLQSAAVTIDEVERITGHDFFASLPDEIENDIESQCDFHYWSTIKP